RRTPQQPETYQGESQHRHLEFELRHVLGQRFGERLVIRDRIDIRPAESGYSDEDDAGNTEQGGVVGAQDCLRLIRHSTNLPHDSESKSNRTDREEGTDEPQQLEKSRDNLEARWWAARSTRATRAPWLAAGRSSLLNRLRDCLQNVYRCPHSFY